MSYRSLDAAKIVATLDALVRRIDERFPERGLGQVARELLTLAQRDGRRAAAMAHPYWLLRLGVAAIVVGGVAAQVFIAAHVRVADATTDVFNLFQGVEAALNMLIIMGAGVFFLTTLEERMKRRRILGDLHELRSIVHVVDMHQLTKDPTVVLDGSKRTKSSPAREMSEFELTRYLDYCAEMLALAAKVAALYAQNMRDPVVIAAVNDIEGLASHLSGKIWQKIIILGRLDETRAG